MCGVYYQQNLLLACFCSTTSSEITLKIFTTSFSKLFFCIRGHALMSGGKVSQRMAGKSSRKRVPEMLEGEEPGLSLKREGWMSLWKNRQKKWSSRGAFSTSQKALRRNGEIFYFFCCCFFFRCHSGGGFDAVGSFEASLLQGLVRCWAWITVYVPEF